MVTVYPAVPFTCFACGILSQQPHEHHFISYLRVANVAPCHRTTCPLDYDQVEHTIEGKNKLLESIALYKKIIVDPKLKNVAKVLLLNKCDLFEEQLKKVGLRVCFPHLASEFADTDLKECVEYISKEFASVDQGMVTTMNCFSSVVSLQI